MDLLSKFLSAEYIIEWSNLIFNTVRNIYYSASQLKTCIEFLWLNYIMLTLM
jgi:hypothetical protein